MAIYKVFNEYNTPALSLEQGRKVQGIHPSGVYFGFDAITDGGGPGINIVINHLLTGKEFVGSGLTLSGKSGMVITPQGKTIHVTGSTDVIPISDNSNPATRIDWVILEHEHVEITGGQSPTISVIQGPTDGTEPSLTNASKQVLLMKVLVPQDASFGDLTSIKVPTPNFNGDTNIAKLNEVQQFTAMQSMYKAGTFIEAEPVPVDNVILHIQSDGNYFILPNTIEGDIINIKVDDLILGVPKLGTVIMLQLSNTLNFRSTSDSDAYGQGFLSDVPDFLNPQNGEILTLRYEALASTTPRWRIIGSTSVVRALNTMYNQINAPTTGILAKVGEIPGIQTDLDTIFYDLSFHLVEFTGGVTANSGSISWPDGGWAGSQLAYLSVINFNGSATITGSPTSLYFDISSGYSGGVQGLSGATPRFGHLYSGSTLLTVETDSVNNRLVVKKADGSSFTGTVPIKGQFTIFAF